MPVVQPEIQLKLSDIFYHSFSAMATHVLIDLCIAANSMLLKVDLHFLYFPRQLIGLGRSFNFFPIPSLGSHELVPCVWRTAIL